MKLGDHAPDSPDGILRMWLVIYGAALRPLLRPSARQDLARYLDELVQMEGVEPTQTFFAWADRLLSTQWADGELDADLDAIRDTERSLPGVFRQPDRAVRPRPRASVSGRGGVREKFGRTRR